MKSFVLGCDNAGVALKDAIEGHLKKMGYAVEYVGCDGPTDTTPYPLIAKKLCESILASHGEKHGILICGTGIGMCMAANKFKGIRAAVAHDAFSAQRAALSNDANVLCLGQRVIGVELAKLIVQEWAPLEFKDGPSTEKVQAILQLEEQNFACKQ